MVVYERELDSSSGKQEWQECGSGIQAGDQDEKTEWGVIQREVVGHHPERSSN